MRRVGKLEGHETVASFLDSSDPLERLKVHLEPASCVDLWNEEDISHGDRFSDTEAALANEPLDGS
jgi:hypothetical protein